METNFKYLIELYMQLGGIAENVCIREGCLGRGVFPVDSCRRTKIATKKTFLLAAAISVFAMMKYTLKMQVSSQ